VDAGSVHHLALLARAGDVTCAIPIASVVETMRPLPIEVIGGVPAYVRGLAIVRGEPTLVVDTARLLGRDEPDPPSRFVVVRTGERRIALLFDEVIGVRPIVPAMLSALPPVVRSVASDAIAAVGVVDAALLTLLETASIVPPELLREVTGG
jgi:purine-binding chemotaxis protein CheW